MPSALSLILHNPAIRLPTIAIFLYGTASAASLPYQSLIGIKDLHLGNSVFAVVTFLASLVSVLASIGVGVVSDRLQNRRPLLIGIYHQPHGLAGGVFLLIRDNFDFIEAIG